MKTLLIILRSLLYIGFGVWIALLIVKQYDINQRFLNKTEAQSVKIEMLFDYVDAQMKDFKPATDPAVLNEIESLKQSAAGQSAKIDQLIEFLKIKVEDGKFSRPIAKKIVKKDCKWICKGDK